MHAAQFDQGLVFQGLVCLAFMWKSAPRLCGKA